MQQLHSVIDEVKQDFKDQDDRIDGKIDALIQLQKERLQLDRERLEFEREKAGLPPKKPVSGQLIFLIMLHNISLFLAPPVFARLTPNS